MMRLAIVIAGILGLAVLAGCGDDTAAPGAASFQLDLKVVDPGGVPVPGLVATLHTPIPEARLGFAKAVTKIPFLVPVDSVRAVLTIGSLDGQWQTVYFDGPVDAGAHDLMFATGALGIERAGTTAYSYELVVTDGGSELFRDAKMMTVYTSVDSEQRPRLGSTDGRGALSCGDRNLFPFLFDLPAQPLIDENGLYAGEFTFRDSVVVTLRDTVANSWQSYPLILDPGTNAFELTWDPVLAARFAPADHRDGSGASPTAITSAVSAPAKAAPSDQFELGQNYPNPFN